MCHVIWGAVLTPKATINTSILISGTSEEINISFWISGSLKRAHAGAHFRAGSLPNLVELNHPVLKVFEVCAQYLRSFVPVLQGAALNITSIFQVPQLAFDPSLSLQDRQTDAEEINDKFLNSAH